MTRLGAAVLGVVVFSGGCAYHNTLYNAQRLYDEAEGHRLAGRDSAAALRYQDVIRKTADAYRGRPSGEGVAETLFLLGRAQLWSGQAREARAALARAASLATTPGLRSEILVYQAIATANVGEVAAARVLVDQALATGLTARALGDGLLLRGRLRLGEESVVAGWDDLDRAGAAHPSVEVEAGVETLHWGVYHRDLDRARSALDRLLTNAGAGERLDTIAALVSAAGRQWSPSIAATMLGDVGAAPWEGAARSELGLFQARLFHLAGDTAAAAERAWRVARGRGDAVAEARLLLATWHLGRTRDLGDAQSVVPILLPAADDPRVASLVDAVDDLDRYSGMGLDLPLGWFAAAEVARDRLEAPILARGLFLAYADTDPSDPWAPKALLAALDVSPDGADRSWLRGRLEAHEDSPYVQAARGGSAAGFEALEEELRVRLSEIAAR